MIAVVVPLYNKERYIKRALLSVVEQTYQQFEVIVVDDGSTDGSVERAREVIDSRIQIIHQSNAGPGPARNTGVAHTVASYVAFLDADDVFLPNHLEEIARLSEIYPDAGVLSTKYYLSKNGELPKSPIANGSEKTRRRKYNYLRNWSHRSRYVWTSCVAVKREIFEKSGGFGDFIPGQDTDLWIRLAMITPFAVSDRQTAVYVRGTGGIMESRTVRNRMPSGTAGDSNGDPIQRTLNNAFLSARDEQKKKDLRRYRVQRLMLGFRANLLHGRIENARAILNEMGSSCVPAVLWWKVCFILPNTVLRAIAVGLAGARRSIRGAR